MKSAQLFLAGLLVACGVSFGDGLTFTVSPVVEFSPPGGNYDPTCQNLSTLSCIIFSSVITPDAANSYNFTDVTVTLDPPSTGLSYSDAFFFAWGPLGINAGDPTDPSTWFAGPTFEIDVDALTAPGIYTGSATLVGGTNPDPSLDTSALGSSSFTIVVSPEPRLGWLALVIVAGLGMRARIRKLATRC